MGVFLSAKKKHKADFFRKKLLKENCTCGIISLSLLQTATVNKGQIISKSNYLAVNSSKKWMNEFVLLLCNVFWLVFGRNWRHKKDISKLTDL